MGNLRENWKLLIAVLALAAAGAGRVGAGNRSESADEAAEATTPNGGGLAAGNGSGWAGGNGHGNGNGADLSNCPDRIIDCKPPRMPWYVRTEGVALARDANHDVNIASLINTSNTVLSTRDLDYPFQLGPRILIGRTINECYQIESSYFNVAQSDDSAAVRDSQARLFSPFVNFPVGHDPEYHQNTFVSIRGTSYMQSAELNLRQAITMPPGRMAASYLVGVRYLTVGEGFEYLSHSGVGPSNFVRTDTGNDLLGLQLGAMLEFFKEDGWWVNFEVKGAVCNNRANQHTLFSIVPLVGAPEDYVGSLGRNGTAFVGDLALTVVYRWGPRASARFGYQAMWIDRLALAADNFNTDVSILTQGPAQLHRDANVVYHGPFAGLELAW